MRERMGNGNHGTVLRVVHKDRPHADSYALKLALRAGDERFEREAHLLSCLSHPSVPRFEERGTWRSPEGEAHPYVVMQWVEGLALYAWALEHGLTLRMAIRPLAQVARALGATHLRGVHRDVKGGNIRVSAEGRAVLLDFGSCWYPEASPLTGNQMPPGTNTYRSPQLLFYGYVLKKGWEGSYEAEAADDVYALGVTAYRLLAGGYPPSDPRGVRTPRGLNEVCPGLGAAGVLVLLVLLGVLLARSVDPTELASTGQGSMSYATGSPEAGPSGVGEEALSSVRQTETPPVAGESITREIPREPLPDQRLPPCTQQRAVVINGGCWRPQVSGADRAPCDSDL